MTPDEFFAAHPNAPGVWVCNGQCFLQHAESDAQQVARTSGAALVWLYPEPTTTELSWVDGINAALSGDLQTTNHDDAT